MGVAPAIRPKLCHSVWIRPPLLCHNIRQGRRNLGVNVIHKAKTHSAYSGEKGQVLFPRSKYILVFCAVPFSRPHPKWMIERRPFFYKITRAVNFSKKGIKFKGNNLGHSFSSLDRIRSHFHCVSRILEIVLCAAAKLFFRLETNKELRPKVHLLRFFPASVNQTDTYSPNYYG